MTGEGEFVKPDRAKCAAPRPRLTAARNHPSALRRRCGPRRSERETLANGLRLLAIEDREQPLVQFELRLKGGLLLDDPSVSVPPTCWPRL